MTKRTKHRLVAVGGVALVVGAACFSYCIYDTLRTDEHEVWAFQQPEAIECSLKWANAAPLPPQANVVSVTTGGSMFTRGFRVTFVATPAEIEDWLQRSPGTRGVIATVPTSRIRHFQITPPGGGAAFAEITVDDCQHRVTIHAYWS